MKNYRTFFQFVVPSVLSFALSGVYTIVDGFFIGNSMGDDGLAAINLAYPIAAFIQAAGTGIGLSGAIRYTILQSEEKSGDAKKSFTDTVLLLLAVSAMLTGAILLTLPAILHLFGAKESIYGLMKSYVQVITIGAGLQIFATGLVPFIRNLGGASFSMFTMIAGFVTNMILDYLFVWVWDFGMAGAAWATVIGQTVTMSLAIVYLVRNGMRLVFSNCADILKNFSVILKIAIAPFGLTFSPQITTILMNRALMLYNGKQAVAAYGCIVYIVAIVYLLLQGVGDGSQPLISRYYGESRMSVLKQMRKLAYWTSGAIAFVCMMMIFLFRSDIGILFGASADTNKEVASYLPLFLSTLLFLAYVRVTTSCLYAMEKAGLSYILVYAEPILIFFLLLLLPKLWFLGSLAVWLAIPAAQAITWCISVIVKHYVDRKNLKDIEHEWRTT